MAFFTANKNTLGICVLIKKKLKIPQILLYSYDQLVTDLLLAQFGL